MEDVENRIAIIGIIISDGNQAGAVNDILHNYGTYIVGRMGIPYREREVSIISIAIDAPGNIINTVAGKLGKLNGVSAKAVYSKV